MCKRDERTGIVIRTCLGTEENLKKDSERVSIHRCHKSPYERTKAAVYATGNKWAIENFDATHN
jgi:hypothetical protein